MGFKNLWVIVLLAVGFIGVTQQAQADFPGGEFRYLTGMKRYLPNDAASLDKLPSDFATLLLRAFEELEPERIPFPGGSEARKNRLYIFAVDDVFSKTVISKSNGNPDLKGVHGASLGEVTYLVTIPSNLVEMNPDEAVRILKAFIMRKFGVKRIRVELISWHLKEWQCRMLQQGRLERRQKDWLQQMKDWYSNERCPLPGQSFFEEFSIR